MAKSMPWISTRYPPIKGMTVHTQTIPEGTGLMLRRSILPRWLIPLALFLCASSPFTNQMPGFGVRLTRDARDTTEVDYYHNGWSGGATSLAGRYRLGTITVTPVSGDPVIDVVAAHPGHGWVATGFGTPCAGSAAREHWHRLGRQWFDADGTGPPLRPPIAGLFVDKFPVSFSVN